MLSVAGMTIGFILKWEILKRRRNIIMINVWNLHGRGGFSSHFLFTMSSCLALMIPDSPSLLDCFLWQSSHYLQYGQFHFQIDLRKIIRNIDLNVSLSYFPIDPSSAIQSCTKQVCSPFLRTAFWMFELALAFLSNLPFFILNVIIFLYG